MPKQPDPPTIRIVTILKSHYVGMFAKRYGATNIRTTDINWFNRYRVVMDIPNTPEKLRAVEMFSSCNSYKEVLKYNISYFEQGKNDGR